MKEKKIADLAKLIGMDRINHCECLLDIDFFPL